MNEKANYGKIKNSLYLRAFLLLFLLHISIFALDRNRTINQFYHTAWTAKDGAPSQISALDQTTDGYLWIVSALGLFRFDGVTFEQYQPPDGAQLPSSNIYALMATPDGGLWISFRPSGLGFLKDGQLKIFSRPEELPKSQVYNFARTPDGRIWAGTQDGLVLFNGAGWDDIGADWNFQPKTIKTLFTDRSGTLWVSQEDSIVYLPPGSKTFQTSEKMDNFAVEIVQAKDDRIWAARIKKLISPLQDSISGSAAKNPVIMTGAYRMLFDRDGSLWLANNEVTRIRFPEQLETGKYRLGDSRIESFKEKDGLSSSWAVRIFEDREGNVWVGTLKGLDRFRYSPIVPFSLPESAPKLTLAANERGDIWAGTAGIDSFLHLSGGRFESVDVTPKDIYTSSLYRDADGSNWWGSSGGIWHQQNTKFRFFPLPKDLAEDGVWEIIRGEGDGGLWVSLEEVGLVYFKYGVWERRKPPDGLPNRGPSASFEDEQKRIWLGYTENRVYVLNGERVRGYTGADGIEIGRIKVIRGRVGNLWCGGETGLAVLIGDRFHTVKADGKAFGAVSGIIATKNGDLWLNEIHGIVRIEAGEIRQLIENPDYAVKYRLFDFPDNLPGGTQMNFTVSTAVEGRDGRLWFATDNGLAMIDPAHLEKNVVPPPVVIKSVFADKKLYDSAEQIKFPAGTANVQINYTATSLSIPERVAFKYRLAGFENGWRDADNRREAFYTNLAPGNYHFQVIAANNDGVWNENGALLEFEILPMFYQTNWFLLLCFLAFGVLVLAGYKWRVSQVKSRLNLLYEERLSERTRIAQDLHDTLLQGIVSVSLHLDTAMNKLSKDSPAQPRLDRMREMMRQIIKEGRNTVNGLRSPDAGGAGNLEEKFSRMSEKMNAHGKAEFRVIVNGAARRLRSTSHDEIYNICHEAFANAFHHSEASVIESEIEYAKNFLKILIRDNGIGIDPLILETGRAGHWGLSGMKERAEKIGAQLKLYSRAGGGTEIELIVPGSVAFQTEKFGLYRVWLNRFFFGEKRRRSFRRKQ